MKARVQCSFHHPYRGKQTTVFAAGNNNYWSISGTKVLVTVCGRFDMMRATWIVIILLTSVLQGKLYSMPTIPLQARTGTVGRRVSRKTHARLVNVQKVKHRISIYASKRLNRHRLSLTTKIVSVRDRGRKNYFNQWVKLSAWSLTYWTVRIDPRGKYREHYKFTPRPSFNWTEDREKKISLETKRSFPH